MKNAAFFQVLEEKLLDVEIRRDKQQVSGLLVEDFEEFTSSGGRYDRDEVVTALSNEPPATRLMQDFKIREIGAEAVLVTYRVTRRDTATGIERRSLRSSIWILQDERWRMLFHQGTPLP